MMSSQVSSSGSGATGDPAVIGGSSSTFVPCPPQTATAQVICVPTDANGVPFRQNIIGERHYRAPFVRQIPAGQQIRVVPVESGGSMQQRPSSSTAPVQRPLAASNNLVRITNGGLNGSGPQRMVNGAGMQIRQQQQYMPRTVPLNRCVVRPLRGPNGYPQPVMVINRGQQQFYVQQSTQGPPRPGGHPPRVGMVTRIAVSQSTTMTSTGVRVMFPQVQPMPIIQRAPYANNGGPPRQVYVRQPPTSTYVTNPANAIQQKQDLTPVIDVQCMSVPVIEDLNLKISNVVCAFHLPMHIDLRCIANGTPNCVHDRYRNVLTKQLRNPDCFVKIFNSGRISIVGNKSEDAARRAARISARIIQKVLGRQEQRVRMRDYRVVNVMANCKLPFGVKISELARKYPREAYYEQELATGLVWQSKTPKGTVRIFSTGSMNIMGTVCEADIYTILNFLMPIVHEFRCAAVSATEASRKRRAPVSMPDEYGKRPALSPGALLDNDDDDEEVDADTYVKNLFVYDDEAELDEEF